MYKNILIPVLLDHSRDNEASMAAARALADDDAQFTLLHVVETIPSYVSEYIPPDFMKENREKMLIDLKEIASKLPKGKAALTDGRTGPRITQWAEENQCDCIVVASHTPAMSDILLGSTAHHVVRHAKCAVHVVR